VFRNVSSVAPPTCRWARERGGICVPMTLGETCEHQGGTFNTFHYEDV